MRRPGLSAEIPGGFSTPSAPAAAVYNNGTLDVLEVAVRGTDNRIYHNQFNPFYGAWTGWGELPGGGATPSGPDMAVYNNAVQVVVRGTDDALYLNRFDGANWSGWSRLPSLAVTPDDPGVDVYNSTLWIYTRDVDGRIFRTVPLSELPMDLAGTSSLAADGNAVSSVAKITCFPRALLPIHAITEVEGSAKTHCTAPMSALQPPDGREQRVRHHRAAHHDAASGVQAVQRDRGHEQRHRPAHLLTGQPEQPESIRPSSRTAGSRTLGRAMTWPGGGAASSSA